MVERAITKFIEHKAEIMKKVFMVTIYHRLERNFEELFCVCEKGWGGGGGGGGGAKNLHI